MAVETPPAAEVRAPELNRPDLQSRVPTVRDAAPRPTDPMGVVEYRQSLEQAYLDAFGPAVQQARADLAKAQAPKLQAIEQELKPALKREGEALAIPAPPVPERAEQKDVPKIGGRPFLDVESKHTLSAIVSGLGLIGQMAMAGRAPIAALDALSGAMQGWTKGDQERATNQWNTYLAEVDRISRNNREALAIWNAQMQQWGGNQAAAHASVINALAKANLPDYAIAAAQGTLKGIVEDWNFGREIIGSITNLTMKALEIESTNRMKEATMLLANQTRTQALAQADQHFQASLKERIRHTDLLIQQSAERHTEKQEQERAAIEAFSPEVLRQMGMDWILYNKAPALGGLRGPASLEVKAKAQQAGIDWAKEQGLDLNQIPAIRAEAAAARGSLLDIDKRQSQIMSFVNNFHSQVGLAREMSDKRDHTGVPVIERYKQFLQGQYLGDPEVVAFQTQVNTVAMEYAKVMVGSAQGDAHTREDARQRIDAAYTPAQLGRIFDQLEKETAAREQGYNTEKTKREEFLKNIRGGTSLAAPKLPAETKMEGGELISESGKYVWRGGQWQPR